MKQPIAKNQLLVFLGLLVAVISIMNLLQRKNISQTQKRLQSESVIKIEIIEASENKSASVFTNDETNTVLSLHKPLSDSENRITKKPFGLWITPETSPVQPEKFSGFHTGTDFEVFQEELEQEVLVFSICDGKIAFKNWVNGYGGVLIQKCNIQSYPATIVYGHIDIEKSPAKINEKIIAGQEIAILASHKSHASDGERKHLHLGIHKGNNIDLRGYVESQKELNNWVAFDLESVLP